MEGMRDALSRKLADAPFEEEEISEEEQLAVAEALEWRKQNNPIALEEVLHEFGLTTSDFEQMGQRPLPADTAIC